MQVWPSDLCVVFGAGLLPWLRADREPRMILVLVVAIVVAGFVLDHQWTLQRFVRHDDDGPEQGDSAIGFTLEPFPDDNYEEPDEKVIGYGKQVHAQSKNRQGR